MGADNGPVSKTTSMDRIAIPLRFRLLSQQFGITKAAAGST